MKEKEYDTLLKDISIHAFGINQLLYEIVIIISIYLFTNQLSTSTNLVNLQFLSQSKNKRSILTLLGIFAVAIDWFIWSNIIQTSLFICILSIYINYSITNSEVISNFIDLTRELSESAPLPSTNSYIDNKNRQCNNPIINELVSLPYDTTQVKSNNIGAFDKRDTISKEINEVYRAGKPYLTLTDSNYAQIMLNELYNTPQYHNLEDIEIGKYLKNDKYFLSEEYAASNKDKDILESLRNPKKVFLDSRWLENKKGIYNDNCIKPIIPKSNGKDAICTLPTDPNLKQTSSFIVFGKPLEQCTNQNYNITDKSLESISSNEIPSMSYPLKDNLKGI
jgi:hypothetical protein